MDIDNNFFDTSRRPYYIYAPSYTKLSAGIRVMHLLCHYLNKAGEEAYVLSQETDPKLRTPLLTQEVIERHINARKAPIAVYPEVVHGNPLRAKSVVRYILNHPGLLGGPKEFDDADMLVFFHREYAGATRETNPMCMLVPTIDTTLFNNRDNDQAREGALVYPGRYAEAAEHFPELFRNSTVITYDWPTTRAELAALLRRSEVLYCFANSAILSEALLCGCPVVFKDSPYTRRPAGTEGENLALLLPGVTASDTPEAIAVARVKAKEYEHIYQQHHIEFSIHLREFIAASQILPLVAANEALSANGRTAADLSTTANSADDYPIWVAKHSLETIHAQLHAERMVRAWHSQPQVVILMPLPRTKLELAFKSITSLQHQLYKQWQLIFVADFEAPSAAFTQSDILGWLQLDDMEAIEQLTQAYNAVLESIPSDWICTLPPGTELAPNALLCLGDYALLHPEWQAIYTDHDEISASGSRERPAFKPDFNLDYFRCFDYVGPAVWFRSQALWDAGGFTPYPGAHCYDALWRLHDRLGAQGIGHIAEPLIHLPAGQNEPPIAQSSRQVVLESHLQRQGIAAQVEAGLLPGTTRIAYPLHDSPLVSIVIPNKDCVWYLRPCLDSIFEKTDYGNFEIMIVDNQTDDPDTLAYYDELRATRADRLRIVGYDRPFNFAAQCNLGVAAANGSLILLLNNDTEIVQENWLSRLVAHALRTDVGVVAPRLLYPETGKIQHAGYILGVDRLGNSGFRDREMDDPGYMNRLQVEQDYSAVSAACLLTSKALYQQVGGMDEAAAPVAFGDIDYCLKVRQSGKLVVWTPFVSVVHHESQTLKLELSTLAGQAAAAERDNAAVDTLLPRWQSWIADDPAYNRHLALNSARAFQVESELVADWDINFHERARILALPPAGGVGEYRFTAPIKGLTDAGHVQSTIVQTHKYHLHRHPTLTELERLNPDVLVQQVDFSTTFMEWQKVYRQHRPAMRTVIMLDDLITQMPKDHPGYSVTPRNSRQLLRQMFRSADRAVVSTEPLLHLMREITDDVHLVPNTLRDELWGHLVSQRRSGRKPRVGWAGAQQHKGDLAIIAEVVEQTAGEVDWIFFGMCTDEIRPYVAEFHKFEVGVEAYPAKLAALNLDLAVAPLVQHPFNEAKSNLRLLEYGILGLPVVCTDIFPYRTDDPPVKRVANDTGAWVEAIRERIHDLDAAAREGDALREWVRRNYMLSGRLDAWLTALTAF